jgi:predicted RNA-binding protein with RPS1 domain
LESFAIGLAALRTRQRDIVDDLKIVLQLLTHFGAYGLLLIVIILLVHDPTRAEKLKLAFLTPFFRFWKWGARQYLATRVSLSVSEFFKYQVTGLLSSTSQFKFKIRWVRAASDPVLKKNGTLILRLEETNDQTRNILSATKVALAKTVCPTLRSQMQPHMQNAIDLALLRKLTERLGKHAHPVFYKYFLEPHTKDDNECAALLTELIEIDRAGLFVAIFLEELSLLGDFTFSSDDRNDKTEAIKKFLVFLLGLARRAEFAFAELDHMSDDIRVGIILLAKGVKAATEGVTPYVKRINQKIRGGCETIYIVAYKAAVRFQNNLVRAIGADVRISVAKISRVPVHALKSKRHLETISIVQLRIGRFAETDFDTHLKESSIKEGDIITGKVLDVAEQVALVSVDGLTGSITRRHCSWSTISRCSDVLSEGEESRFEVGRIDQGRGMLILTRRFEDEDPFQCYPLPNCGDTIEVHIHAIDGNAFIAKRDDGLEVQIPFVEASWLDERPNPANFLDRSVPVQVYEIDTLQRVVRASLRRLDPNPWPSFHKRFPNGTRMRGKVVEVNKLLHFIRVSIADGVTGIVPAENMIAAGYEYSDFENTIAVGQVLDVVVTKVFLSKQKIRLDLQRNQSAASKPDGKVDPRSGRHR